MSVSFIVQSFNRANLQKFTVNRVQCICAADLDVAVALAPCDFSGAIKATVTAAGGVTASAEIPVNAIAASETYTGSITIKPAAGPNLVKCGDFQENPSAYWTIKNINNDAVEAMTIADGCLKVARPTACDNNYRFVCYNELENALEAGKWYKMSVRISVPTPCTWYSRGIDLGFVVFGKDPATLNDYKANNDVNFFVDTDMEAARKEVGPLHGTDGYVNFPTVCTYCNPADLKTNGGIFKAVAGQKWVGFYLRQRNTLTELNPVYFDDVMIQEVDEPAPTE